MSEYIFRIEKRGDEHPLTPEVLAEFGCAADNPRALIEAVVAFGELLQIHRSPENVIRWMRHNAAFENAKLFVEEHFNRKG